MKRENFYNKAVESNKKVTKMFGICVFTYFVLLVLALVFVPNWIDPVSMDHVGTVGIVCVIPLVIFTKLYTSRMAKSRNLICPSCGLSFLSGKYESYTEKVLGTGRCPKCDHIIIEDYFNHSTAPNPSGPVR